MTTKEIAIKIIHQLAEDATWEDIQEGLRELDEGKGIAHQKVNEEFSEWLSS